MVKVPTIGSGVLEEQLKIVPAQLWYLVAFCRGRLVAI